jgi:hypothetical protein
MIAFRMVWRCLCAFALATAAQAQAIVEYAAKSATGALSGHGTAAHVGACRVDSTLVPCLRQFYPATFYVAVAAICIFLASLMYRNSRA